MENLSLITSGSMLYLIVITVVAWLVMYFARKPFHRSMASMGRIIYNGMRMAASSVKLAEKRVEIRNQEVLLRAGIEMAEHKVEREFDRISVAVQHTLEGYPKVQRKLTEDLLKLEEDYEKSAEIPRKLPDWVKVIDAIANIKPTGDHMVVNMLEEIHGTLNEQHKAAMEKHRADVAERHNILSRMLPAWRRVQKTVGSVEKRISELNQRSKKIDRYMADYEKIHTQMDIAERQLSSSSLTQFFIAGVVLAVAIMGAFINFHLVALPMSEMVGGHHTLGDYRVSDVAGMLIVSLEIVLGFFIMDALRITRLFSIIGSMEDRKRILFLWLLFGFLLLLAGVEAALALMREGIAADMEALRRTLEGSEASEMVRSNIPKIGQMVMGFILPFILAFVAIPFESFVASSRTVLGLLCGWGLRVLAFLLRLLGNIGFYSARLIVNIYDMLIFPALYIEDKIAERRNDVGRSETKNMESQKNHVVEMEEGLDISPLMGSSSQNKEATA